MNIEKLANDMVEWIKDYCQTNGIKSLIVGVSGGVDSAVVASLCVRTGLPTICASLPMDFGRDKDAYDKAIELCNNLGLGMVVCRIGDIVEGYRKGCGFYASLFEEKLSEGNLRSRIRANILYALAAKHDGIVMGTGNKDEDDIGYATKGGDLLTDLNVMSDIHKSVVWELAKFLGVPESIINAKPTAGLWDGQTDEEELGMTYAEVEWAIEWDDNPELMLEEVLENRQKEVLAKVRSMRRKNAHKLHYPPVFRVEMNKYERHNP